MTTANMLLDLPTVSTTLGPEWATKLITALERIDLHDHTTGLGVAVNGIIGVVTPSSYPHTVVTANKQKVLLVTTTSARTITLPTAASAGTSFFFMIKDISGQAYTNNITVSRSGSDLIDGSSSYALAQNYGAIGLVSDGTSNWYIV